MVTEPRRTVMKKVLYAGLSALALLAACSKQEPPAPAAVADPDAEDMVSHPPAAPKPAKPKNWNRMATGMMTLLADAPECQRYKDEMLAIAQTPLDGTPPRDPVLVIAEAHDQHCSKKSREQ
jgi:hypothetical protein